MRLVRTALATVAAATSLTLAGAPPANADHCPERPPLKPVCVLPHYCVWHEDGRIECW